MDEINVSNSTFGQRQRKRCDLVCWGKTVNVGTTLSWTLSVAVRSLSLNTDKWHCKLSHQARYFPPGDSLHENHKGRLTSKQVGICHKGLTSPSLHRGFNTENPKPWTPITRCHICQHLYFIIKQKHRADPYWLLRAQQPDKNVRKRRANVATTTFICSS